MIALQQCVRCVVNSAARADNSVENVHMLSPTSTRSRPQIFGKATECMQSAGAKRHVIARAKTSSRDTTSSWEWIQR